MVFYNSTNGKFCSGIVTDMDAQPSTYELKDKKEIGTALIVAFIPFALRDVEFQKYFEQLGVCMEDGFTPTPELAQAAYILYRRIGTAEQLQEADLKVSIPNSGKIPPYFGNMQINKITATIIRKWQTTLISYPNGYSETYLKTIHNQVSAILNFACKYYRLPENPARICGAMGKKNADCMLFWTVDEFKRFIETINQKIVSTTTFNLLFWSGMRSGEMLALTLNDFEFDLNTVSITKNFARLDNEDLILEPKTPKSKRKITLPPFVCDLIKAYVEKLVDYEPNERLFNVTKHYLKHEINRGCKKSGVRAVRIHDLRHSHASLLIEMGFSPLLISERLSKPLCRPIRIFTRTNRVRWQKGFKVSFKLVSCTFCVLRGERKSRKPR